MTVSDVSDLTAAVTRRTVLAGLAAAVAAGWLGGMPGALGVLTGGALAVLSFRLLAARAVAAASGPALTAPWLVLASLRFAAVSGAAAALFAAGWAHPVAWLAGYSVLPLAVVLQGLRLAREESRA
jgi:hypothetical protein